MRVRNKQCSGCTNPLWLPKDSNHNRKSDVKNFLRFHWFSTGSFPRCSIQWHNKLMPAKPSATWNLKTIILFILPSTQLYSIWHIKATCFYLLQSSSGLLYMNQHYTQCLITNHAWVINPKKKIHFKSSNICHTVLIFCHPIFIILGHWRKYCEVRRDRNSARMA
jgi:hypothetical protein